MSESSVARANDVRSEIVVDGCRLSYRRDGAGVPVLFLHGEDGLSLAGIAHEQLAKAAILDHDDDAILVHVVASLDEKWQRRRENVEHYTVAGCPTRSAPYENNWDSMLMRCCHGVSVRPPVICLPRIENHPDRHRLDDRKGASDMIAMGMS
jgi:hypothetical protein